MPNIVVVVYADVLDSPPPIRHAPDKLGPILSELAEGHGDSEQSDR